MIRTIMCCTALALNGQLWMAELCYVLSHGVAVCRTLAPNVAQFPGDLTFKAGETLQVPCCLMLHILLPCRISIRRWQWSLGQ